MITLPVGVTQQAAGAAPGFLPTDVLGLEIWLDGLERGTTTNQWDDKSGNSNHFNGTGHFPTFSASGAYFSGTDGTADNPNNPHVSGPYIAELYTATEIETFLLLDSDYIYGTGNDYNCGLYDIGTLIDGTDFYPFYLNNKFYLSAGSAQRPDCGTVVSPNAWHVINTISTSSEFTARTYDVQRYTTATNTVDWPITPNLGRSQPSSSGNLYYFYGHIKAFLAYSRKLTTQERADVHDYLDAL